jgi:hypothetical protein
MTLERDPALSSARLSTSAALAAQSPVCWGAIWAGAGVAVAVSLVFTLAAAGLGYSLSYSGLSSRGSLSAFTPVSGAVAIVVQVVASALGGYLAGRLRTVWVGLHADESHFRDTAHGLITWAVATLAGLLLGALVLVPYAQQLAASSTLAAVAPPTPDEMARAAHIAAQASLFVAVGMLLGAFVAAVAARIGGLRHEEMHDRSVA